MDTYLHDCRYLISEKIQKAIPDHTYHRKKFERVSEWEILEYRFMLEKDIERYFCFKSSKIYLNIKIFVSKYNLFNNTNNKFLILLSLYYYSIKKKKVYIKQILKSS